MAENRIRERRERRESFNKEAEFAEMGFAAFEKYLEHLEKSPNFKGHCPEDIAFLNVIKLEKENINRTRKYYAERDLIVDRLRQIKRLYLALTNQIKII
jgi:hypothetical protein